MMQMRFATKGILFTALALICIPARPVAAQAQQDQSKVTYTIPEYNAFQAARAETNAQNRLKLLDDFVTKFPSSTLMTYVDQLYISTYTELKNYPKVIEYADKMLAMGDKLDTATRLQTLQTRVQVFPFAFNAKAPDAHDQLTKERDAAKDGADLLGKFPKPADSKLTDEQFAEQKKPGIAFFDAAAGFADLQLKDYPAAIEAFKGATANNPKDAISYYRLGLSYLGATPPQSVDGFWALARAINLGVPDADKIKDYLHKAIYNYEQPGCETSVDEQLNELLTLAGTSGDRPATYTIPAAADLQKSLEGIRDSLGRLDQTLIDAANNAGSKMQHQLDQLRARAARAELRHSEVLGRHAELLSNALYPNKTLQEREIAGIYFISRHGVEFLRNVYEAINPDCLDHQVISL